MKTRFSRILGIGLTVAVLASLLVAATPASAGYLSWTKDSAPKTVSGIDVVDLVAASNGTTGYAAATDNVVYKTTDGGLTWTKTGFAGGVPNKVALAPDLADGSFVAVVADGKEAWVSTNGGTTFSEMTGFTVSAVNDIAVSPALGSARSVAIGGDNSTWLWTSSSDFGGGSTWTNVMASGNVTAGPALAVEFSPNYLGDRTLVVVSIAGANAKLNLYNVATKFWNADYSVYGIGDKGMTIVASAATKADLALPAGFNAFDTSRVAYVALSDVGLYRNGTLLKAEATNSVALNAAGDKLVAAAASGVTVYRAENPSGTTVTVAACVPTKNPGYANSAISVEFFGANVVAASQSTESAVSLSTDFGKTFNDVAFIDTVATPSDFAINADASKMYLVTENAGVVSLWSKTTTWQRIYKAAGSGFVVRPAADNFDAVYFVDVDSQNILYSSDAGMTTWAPRVAYDSIDDFAAESVTTLYVLSAGKVSKATDGGYLWSPAVDTKAGDGGTMTLLAKDNLLVAGDTGVSYSTDGGTTWTSTGLAFPGANYAVADKLAAGGIITAASDTEVKTFTVGTSTAFSATAATATYNPINGVVLNAGTTYAMSNNGAASEMLRSKISAAAWTKFGVSATALKGLKAAGAKLYSMAVAGTDANSIFVFEEIAVAAGPAQTGPADKFVNPINAQTGGANNIVFQWTAIPNCPTGAVYTLQIALDSNFTQVVKPIVDVANTMVIVGPTAETANQFAFQADTTYYWRVRLQKIGTNDVDSKWSTTRSFKTDTLAPLSLQAPASGTNGVSVNPTFVWSAAPGATTYELVVSDDPTFAIITFSRTSSQPVFASDEQLAYNTVYYWRVRASAPATAVTSWATGVFTTEAKPVPTTTAPSTTQPVTTTTFTIDVPPPTQAIPSYLLWIIIGIGAILVIALIVLIVRTRRVS